MEATEVKKIVQVAIPLAATTALLAPQTAGADVAPSNEVTAAATAANTPVVEYNVFNDMATAATVGGIGGMAAGCAGGAVIGGVGCIPGATAGGVTGIVGGAITAGLTHVI